MNDSMNDSANDTPRLQRLLKFGALMAVAAAVLVWPIQALLASQAETIWFVQRLDDAAIDVNRQLFDAEGLTGTELRREVMAIYSSRSGDEPERALFLDQARVIRPEEVAGLALYDIRAGKPLQAQTVAWVARMTSLGAAATALALFALLWFLRRRATSHAAKAAAVPA